MNKSLLEVCNITTGNLDSNAATKNGRYPFFTCAPEPLRINDYAFDDDVILLAGNNAQGNFHLTRYKGKFNAYQRTYILTARKGFDVDYIRYSLELYINHLKKVSQGSQTKFLTMGILEQFRINDIPYDLQKNQVSMLIAIDKKIELNKKINATLEAMAKILYNYWFVQFDFPDENGKPYKTSGGKMIYNAELGREIPADWEVGKLSDCIKNINTGLNPRDNFILNNGGDIKYVTVKNLTATGQIDFSNCDYIDVSSKNLIHKRSDISKDDILFASIAPLGRCFLIFEEPKDWEINESVFSIRSSKLVNEIFLYMYFKSNEFIKLASLSSTGSIFKGIRVETLLNINIAIPSKAILNKFKDKVNFALRKIHHYWKENQNLIALRDWLLPMLMNGQVNFKD